MENSRPYLLPWTDVLQKEVVGCPCYMLRIPTDRQNCSWKLQRFCIKITLDWKPETHCWIEDSRTICCVVLVGWEKADSRVVVDIRWTLVVKNHWPCTSLQDTDRCCVVVSIIWWGRNGYLSVGVAQEEGLRSSEAVCSLNACIDLLFTVLSRLNMCVIST